MKPLQVQTSFRKLRDADLEIRGAAVVSSMTGNEHFPDLAPEVALVQTAHVSFAQALAEFSANGGRPARARKDDCRKNLVDALHVLAVRINLKATGNQPVLESTGFPLIGGTINRVASDRPPGKIEGIKFTRYEHTGSIRARVKPVAGAKSYKWQYAEAPATDDSQWITVEVAASNWLFNGLTIGKFYAFRAAGLGKVPGLIWSDPVVVMAI